MMPQNVTADVGCSLAFICMTTGGPGNTFQWSHNGQLLQGENSTMLMLSAVSAESGGYYACKVTNDAGNGSDFGIASSKCNIMYNTVWRQIFQEHNFRGWVFNRKNCAPRNLAIMHIFIGSTPFGAIV